jgi:tetratricopeptide (TPR) repeat protein
MRIVPLALLILISASTVFAAETITVYAGRDLNTLNIDKQGDELFQKGDLEGAKKKYTEALQREPDYWPALYSRAQVYMRQRKYELAIQDCNSVLLLRSAFGRAGLLRAKANARLGRYKASLDELDRVISLRYHNTTHPYALGERAWIRATCPDAAFRNPELALRDAKMACNVTGWKNSDLIDTLATAYAVNGDFNAAVSTQERAIAAETASDDPAPGFKEEMQKRLAMFRQHRASPR